MSEANIKNILILGMKKNPVFYNFFKVHTPVWSLYISNDVNIPVLNYFMC